MDDLVRWLTEVGVWNIVFGAFFFGYFAPWVVVSIVFPYLYPRVFAPLDFLFRSKS